MGRVRGEGRGETTGIRRGGEERELGERENVREKSKQEIQMGEKEDEKGIGGKRREGNRGKLEKKNQK